MGSKNLGPGVSGYLNPDERAWETTVFQAGKPVLDKELNLQQDVDGGAGQLALRRAMPSGWLSEDFLSTSDMSAYIFSASLVPNEYGFPNMFAHVNGWIIPVGNTGGVGDNRVDLGAAPVGAGIKRTDLVILEVWRKLIAPAPSTDGKSGSGRIWRNGNVKVAPADDLALNFADDIKDVILGAESTKRVQIQYRIRVIQGVDLFATPYGMEDPAVFANSVPPNAATPDGVATVFSYANQGTVTGDGGLWVAGDGIPTNTLGTVDGYIYAIPLTAVFRRNQTAFDRNSNQNGGVADPGPSDRPDGLFYDIIASRDVADLRLGVNPSGWNFSEVLAKNLNYLFDNKIRTEWFNALQGGGNNGHSPFIADEIGISNANGGDGIITGDTPGGNLIGQFDATRRFFSDRSIYETVVVKVPAPGGGWLPNSVVTINPTPLEISPYAPFNWAAYNSNEVMFLDVLESWWIGAALAQTRLMTTGTITGLGVRPVGPVTIDVGTDGGLVTTEDLYVTMVVAYPRGLGLTMTPTEIFSGTISVNNPAQLPAIAPVQFFGFASSNTFDFPHREIQLQYETSNITVSFAANSAPVLPPGWDFFLLTERASVIVAVLKNGVPIVGGTTLGVDGRRVTFTNPLDFTIPGDSLTVTYVAIRPMPQNNEQITFYYEARAPQALRSSTLGLRLEVIPRYVGNEVYCLAVGSGSEDEAYPYPFNYVQMGGIYPTSGGTFNGDHELAASAKLAVTDFSSSNGLLKLPTFVGYTPAPEEVAFIRGLADTDIENRSYFPSVSGLMYIPNAFSQQLSDAKRHRNIVPMIAELTSSTLVGQKGQLVLVLLLREAFFDSNNGVSFEPAVTNTTTASVFHLKGHLLNKGS